MAADILFVVAEKLAQFPRVSNLSTAYSGIKWMETKLRRVHELLKEDPGLEMNHKELRKWVRDLTDAAQNIEDIVDNFDFNVERQRQRKGSMSSAFLAVKDKVSRYKIVAEVMQAKEKMGRICESMPNKQVFGFDKVIDEIVKLLVEGNDPHPLYMFIVGPCGAGKTTLVKEVYNSVAVKKQFPYRFWLCGQEYKSQIKMSEKVTGFLNVEARSISDALQGKRYLIVLDINLRYPGDINPREDFIIKDSMSKIREAFPDERNGSRVVVTCNDKKDADRFGQEIRQEIEVRKLGMLSSEEKWKLFLNTCDFDDATAGTSFRSGIEETVRERMHSPSEIVNFGDQLVHPNHYQVDGPVRTLSKIVSSFSLLESPLKLFFLYCSLFPKGFEIPRRRVIGQWLAAGWLQRRKDEQFFLSMERLKSMVYLEELSHLGTIQVEYSYLRVRVGYSREDCVVKRIRLESPVWDFAAMKAMQYNLSHNTDSSSSNARVLSLHSIGIYNHIFRHKKTSVSNVRSLLCFPQLTVIGGEVTFPMPPKSKMIRVLDLEDMYFITLLSEDIGELVHLRYLGLRRTGLYSLPNSIGNLKNLESLDIRGTRVKPVPIAAIQKLKRLQYLYMDMDDGSTDDNDSLDVSSLESLRVLSVIRVGHWMKNGLGQLIYLRKLGIYGDPLDYQYAPQAMLEMRNLRSLRLGFGFGDMILENFLLWTIWSLYLERPLQKLPSPYKFPLYLTKLCLKWSLLEQDPMATLEQLEYLAVLKLRCGSFLGKKMVCSVKASTFGFPFYEQKKTFGFPELRFLELNLLDGLEEWTVEKGAMPKLQHLVIRLCNRLKELPQGLLHLHRIEKLEVAGMPDTFNARLQYNKGEDWHKIKHIKSVTVDGIQMAASSSSSSYSFQPYREI